MYNVDYLQTGGCIIRLALQSLAQRSAQLLSTMFIIMPLASCGCNEGPGQANQPSGEGPPARQASSQLSHESTIAPQKPAMFSSEYSEEPVRLANGGGTYGSLEVKAAVVATRVGEFTVVGSLKHGDLVITDRPGSTSSTSSRVSFLGGPTTWMASLRFSGDDIRARAIDGPYTVELVVMGASGRVLDQLRFETRAYHHTDFSEHAAMLVSIEELATPSSTATYGGIRVRATVEIVTMAKYVFQSSLFFEDIQVAFTETQVLLRPGREVVECLLSGAMIGQSGRDGPYVLQVYLSDDKGNQLGNQQMNTKPYRHLDFR